MKKVFDVYYLGKHDKLIDKTQVDYMDFTLDLATDLYKEFGHSEEDLEHIVFIVVPDLDPDTNPCEADEERKCDNCGLPLEISIGSEIYARHGNLFCGPECMDRFE